MLRNEPKRVVPFHFCGSIWCAGVCLHQPTAPMYSVEWEHEGVKAGSVDVDRV